MITSPTRITKLDGLRGLLSLVVALNHSFLVVAIPVFANVWGQNYLEFHDLQSKIQQILMILGNGGVAVTLFFVLSGMVLGQSLSRLGYTTRSLLAFYTKRIIRLYPVYLFVILLTALYMRLSFVHTYFPFASTWYSWWLNFEMTFREFIYNLFFIHTYLGGVTWTLRVILIASFIFPFFYRLTRKTHPILDLILAYGLIYASFTILNFPDFRDLRYLYMFFLGIILPKFRHLFSNLPSRLVSISVPVLTILLLVIRYTTDEYRGGVVESLISWTFIGLIVYHEKTKLFDFLNSKWLQFFGKISYSLYLIHFTVLYISARFMFQLLPGLDYPGHFLAIHTSLFFVSLGLATVISTMVYKFIEEPSLTLANAVGHKISSP